jgi:hypothetical protein
MKLGAASPVDLGMMAERLKGLTLLLATPWPIKANYLFFLAKRYFRGIHDMLDGACSLMGVNKRRFRAAASSEGD